jgi:L-lactate dehydrogenase complex protein LldG
MTAGMTEIYEQFASQAAAYGVEVTRCAPSETRETLETVVDQPAIGTTLPWEDVSLPASVTTDPTTAALDEAVIGVTPAALAVADYGSIVVRATPDGTEPVSLFPDRHVAVLRARDIVPDMATAFEWFGDEVRASGGSAILATGPSATADMGELVEGAHGPREVHVIVVI